MAGFLHWYSHPPWPIDRWVWSINLTGIMRAFSAYPMRRIPERLVIEILREVYAREGNIELSHVLNTQWIERFRTRSRNNSAANFTLAQALGWRYRALLERKESLLMLNRAYLKKYKAIHTEAIEAQLDLFARILDRGGILMMMPEGTLSPDGSLSRIREGLHRIVSTSQADMRLLPVNITYDFMTPGRMTVFLNIGQETKGIRDLSKVALDSLTRNKILELHTITLGNLASRQLLEKARENGVLDSSELASHLFQEAQGHASRGFRVDERLLREHSFNRRFQELIDYCVKRGILSPGSRYLRINREKVLNAENKGHLLDPMGYSNSEYMGWWSEAKGNLP